METKVCSLCKKEKEITEYYYNNTRQKYFSRCKQCIKKMSLSKYQENKEKRKEYKKQYYKKNKDVFLKKAKENYINNREQKKEYSKRYYYENRQEKNDYSKEYYKKNYDILKKKQQESYLKNKDYILKRQQEYYINHKEERKEYYKKYRKKPENKIKINNYIKQRKKEDKLYEFSNRIRHLIKRSISKMGYTKKSKTYQILGCDFETVYNHLLKTYKKNYGVDYNFKEKVHIDHIIPISTAKTEEDVVKLCHYTNLQILKAEDNLKKSNKLNWINERK